MNHPEIRMIVCDVDGTLLDRGCSAVSDEVFRAIKAATDAGIQFVIASGRCCADLSRLFAPVLDLVTLICSDGALAVKNGGILYSSPIETALASDLISVASHDTGATAVIYCKDSAYALGAHSDISGIWSVSGVNEICGSCYKIAFRGLSDFTKYKIRSFAERSGKLAEVYADIHWTEFVSKNTDKGAACSYLQSQWGISPFQTAAFGDNTNDFGMLRCARLTYASPAAIADIKRMCKYNTDNIPNEIIKLSQGRGTL